ncbi:permease [Clostridiisalibacter paucivorans]|uniref:permease n=1 Tax=Clostridiisalibacter paucivorans TaxID=408753 RepID=UPI000684C8BA|nr:permease [Clostridiisalibacter paucivorans]
MKLIKKTKENKLITGIIFIYILLSFLNIDKATTSMKNSTYYIIEMIQILPIVFIVTGLIEAWIPREIIMKNLGEQSGLKGGIISFVLGSISAGPIYAAFPISKLLLKKGASIYNIVILLSSWAVVKVPMLANEAKFLGPSFMTIRWIFTIISIFFMAYIISLMVDKKNIPELLEKSTNMNQDGNGEELS